MTRPFRIVLAVLGFCVVGGGWLLVATASRYASAAYHAGKAPALARAGRLDEAIAESRLAVKAAPKYAPGHNNLGFYLFKQRKFAEAEAECREAVRLDPKDSHAHDSLGQVLSHTGRADEAVRECREAVRLGPSAVHINGLAYALSKEGQEDEARRDWQQVTTMSDPTAAAEAQAMLVRRPR